MLDDLERVALVVIGRTGPDLWTNVWYDVSDWNREYDEEWTREDFGEALAALVKHGYVEPLAGGPAIRLTDLGRGRYMGLEEGMQEKGLSCTKP